MSGAGAMVANGLFGGIEKAVLVIHDTSALTKNLGADGKPKESAGNSGVPGNTANALLGNAPPTYPGSEERYFRVKFNPSQLTMHSDTKVVPVVDAKTGKYTTETVERPRIILTVPLYFDEVKVWDAFLWDRFHRPENIAFAAADLAMNRKRTVQRDVEALLAAIQDQHTRFISFRWAQFAFIGQLSRVQVKYTMFSPSGRPIRAQMLLQICHEADDGMMQNWFKCYNKIFPKGVETSLALGSQGFGTILGG